MTLPQIIVACIVLLACVCAVVSALLWATEPQPRNPIPYDDEPRWPNNDRGVE